MLSITAILLAAAQAAGPSESAGVHYTLSPVMQGRQLKAIDVEIAFIGEGDGETEVELANNWGSRKELWRGLTQVRIEGGERISTGGDPAHRIVQHAPGAKLTVRYRLKQFWAGEAEGVEGRPIFAADHFHFLGWAAFAQPKWSSATPATVSFKNFPRGWRLVSDLQHGDLTLGTVRESVTVGGDFRVLKAEQLRIAIRGSWTFSDDQLLHEIEPVIASHNKFWGDPPSSYLITVLPVVLDKNSTLAGGTGLGDAFAFYATANIKIDRYFTRGLAHEHMHTWIPLRVGRMWPGNEGLEEAWLSEGFTDFYTHRLLARDGLWPIEVSVEILNEVMWTYAFSPARNATNEKLGAEFWRDQAMKRMPYQRGQLVAAYMDQRLRRESGGAYDLDDVMLEMRRAADAVGAEDKPTLRPNFLAAAKSVGADFADELKRFVDAAETILLPADIWAPCGKLETSQVAEYDRGFKGGRSKANGVVMGADPDGPAYAAGLRDGMKIIDLDLSGPRDARIPLTVKVVVDGEAREITYLPEGKRRETVQELKLAPLDEAGREACAARLGGVE